MGATEIYEGEEEEEELMEYEVYYNSLDIKGTL